MKVVASYLVPKVILLIGCNDFQKTHLCRNTLMLAKSTLQLGGVITINQRYHQRLSKLQACLKPACQLTSLHQYQLYCVKCALLCPKLLESQMVQNPSHKSQLHSTNSQTRSSDTRVKVNKIKSRSADIRDLTRNQEPEPYLVGYQGTYATGRLEG